MVRTSSLYYSVAEYCCPVWARSRYTSLIDTQLHSSMRLISGCHGSTPLSWRPVMAPPSLRHKAASNKMLQIIEAHPNWPVYADVFQHPPLQLAYWRPIWSDMTSVDTTAHWRLSLAVGFCGQLHYCNNWPCYPAAQFRSPSSGQGPCQITSMRLWPAADYEPYRGFMSIDKVLWRTTTTSRSRRWRSQVAGVYSELQHSQNKHCQWWVAPSSLDLNPLDSGLVAILESYHKLQLKPQAVPKFKDALQLIWSALPEIANEKAVRHSQRKQLQTCVSANVRHFQWRRQLWGTEARAPSRLRVFEQFHF